MTFRKELTFANPPTAQDWGAYKHVCKLIIGNDSKLVFGVDPKPQTANPDQVRRLEAVLSYDDPLITGPSPPQISNHQP